MYKINIVCVGKLKEKFYLEAQNEYIKRLQRFCDINLVEIQEFPLASNPNKNDIKRALDKEYESILPNLKGYIFVCDPNGKHFDSIEFSNKITKEFNSFDTLTFVIGSSYGLSEKIKLNNNLISFSKMTFPHHLMRVVLFEQIYRAFCIKNNITYHK